MVRDAEIAFVDLRPLVPGAVSGNGKRWRERNGSVENSANFLLWNNEPDVKAV